MRTDLKLPQEFMAIKDPNEEICWVGTPNFTAFIARGIPFLIIGLLWGAFNMLIMQHMKNAPPGALVQFFIIHLLPFWLCILNMLRLFLVYGNTCYAISNKRVMMRSGFWGTDFDAIDYKKISDINVDVNPVENILGVGTIGFFSGRTTSKGLRIYDTFIGIERPYEVLKRIKEVSVEI